MEKAEVSGAPRAYVKEILYRQGMCDLPYALVPRVSVVLSTSSDPKNLPGLKSEILNAQSYMLALVRLQTSIF